MEENGLGRSEQAHRLSDGVYVIQGDDGLRSGTDALMLARFARLYPGEHMTELCGGSGTVSLLLAAENPTVSVTLVELAEALARRAERSAALSGLSGRMTVVNGDIREFRALFPDGGRMDAVAVNPPYLPVGSGEESLCDLRRLARHEVACTLEDVLRAAAWLLRTGGRFYMVYRCGRMVDALCEMRAAEIEPKRLTYVQAAAKPPSLFLIEGKKGGAPGLILTEPMTP